MKNEELKMIKEDKENKGGQPREQGAVHERKRSERWQEIAEQRTP